jgi:membrane-associated phospholipid phosphatase
MQTEQVVTDGAPACVCFFDLSRRAQFAHLCVQRMHLAAPVDDRHGIGRRHRLGLIVWRRLAHSHMVAPGPWAGRSSVRVVAQEWEPVAEKAAGTGSSPWIGGCWLVPGPGHLCLARHSLCGVHREPWRVGKGLLLRVVGPACVLWLFIVGAGFLLRASAGFIHAEDSIDRGLAAHRSATWNSITFTLSSIGNREIVAAVVVLSVALVWWRTSDVRLAFVPALAVLVAQVIFLLASTVVHRARPAVVRLDQAPFTSSYPSGHVGATTALYISLGLVALRLQHELLRRSVVTVCVLVPMTVMFARLYRGMHHPTDVAAGMLVGLVCAWLAHNWYLHTRHR